MILQSDTRLNESIRQNGCCFMAILFLAGQKTGRFKAGGSPGDSFGFSRSKTVSGRAASFSVFGAPPGGSGEVSSEGCESALINYSVGL